MFDGRDMFQLRNYWEKPYEGEVLKGSTVMLLFTVKKGNLPAGVEDAYGVLGDIKQAKIAIYLNILAIIVLSEPADNFSNSPSQGNPEAFGVDSIVEFWEDHTGGNGVFPC